MALATAVLPAMDTLRGDGLEEEGEDRRLSLDHEPRISRSDSLQGTNEPRRQSDQAMGRTDFNFTQQLLPLVSAC